MGSGLSYKCENCGEHYSINLGVGFGFPSEYEELNKDIHAGKYGEEWKALIESEELVQADAEYYFYYCKSCGKWKVDKDASLYAPNNVETLKKKRFGEKTVEEWGFVPYETFGEENREYHLLKNRIHLCPACNHEMERYSADSFSNQLGEDLIDSMPCPYCGQKNYPDGGVMWD